MWCVEDDTDPKALIRGAVAAALACLAAAAFAPRADAGISPELDAELRRALPIERIPVIATLTNQADPGAGDRPAQILGSLRLEAQLTQPGLLARVGLVGARGYWIVNAVSASALPLQVRLLAADPAVARVELDPSVTLSGEPVPPHRSFQVASQNWGLDAVRAPAAWREVGTTGAGVSVGSIDTGADAAHPVLAGKVAGWRDLVAGRPTPYDDNGHGTHTAGSVAGGDAQRAPLGVAPGAKLLVAKAIPASGVGAGSNIIAAAQWLADPDDNPATADFPAVISNSWGELTDPNDTWFRPVLRRWRELGIVPVFAAGNTGPDGASVGSPGGYPEALAVGAVDRDRRVAPFSSRGPVAWQNRDGLGPAAGTIAKPDLAGPGVAVVSVTPGGGYQAYSGTSMAAPHVAGVAALVRAANPTLTVPEVERMLTSTAADVGAAGRDNETGDGLVDALAATRAAARLPGASARVEPARRTVRKRSGRVRVTIAQLRINRKIALTAVARVGRLEQRLGIVPAGPSPVTAAATKPIRRISAGQMMLTQRISQLALRRATAVQAQVAGAAPAVATTGRPSGRVVVSVRQLLINQRIAQAALRRVAEAEGAARLNGLIPD